MPATQIRGYGRWYGRGIADNKGQHSVNMQAMANVLAARGRLGFNAKFLIEMGEETGSPGLRDLCETLGIVMTIEDSWGGDVATAAIAHLAGSTRPEFLFTSTDFNSYIDVSVADDAPRRAEGRLAVPTTPGLGLHVDESRLPAPVLSMP